MPDKPPYVLLEDKEKVEAFNIEACQKARQAHVLDLDQIPEAFVGSRHAPVVLLGNNPGIKSREAAAYKRESAFADRMRDNLLHRLADDFPFLFLDPNPVLNPPGVDWWQRKLKDLLCQFGPKILARSILAVEFFPYASRRGGRG